MANRGGQNRNRGTARRGGSNHTPSQRDIRLRLGNVTTYNRDRNGTYSRSYTQNNANNTSVATLPAEAKVKALSKEFIKSYYELFDQQGRPNLHSLYNQEAIFTFSTTHSMTPPPTEFGRNLLKIPRELRDSLMFRNKTPISELFSTFPHSKHIVQSFTYDIPFYLVNPMSVTSMNVIINGVYEDLSATSNQLRAFTRVFLIKQVGAKDNGDPTYEIFNDLFMLQTPTADQIKRYLSRKIAEYTPKQEEIIGRVMIATRLNRKGATQLLKEKNWDEAESMVVYQQLDRDGLIPPDLLKTGR